MVFQVLRLIRRVAAIGALLFPLLAAADPPARVGRLSLAEGAVTFRLDRQDPGSPASVNWPISSGAILDTAPGARAEVWIGGSAFRLAGASRAEYATVDDQRIVLQLAEGSLALSLHDRDQIEGIEINTPAAVIRFGAAGRYRIDVDAGGTVLSTHAGTAYLYAPAYSVTVPAGRRAVFETDGGYSLSAARRPDSFDDWAAARDAARRAETARRYVPPEMTGYEELDRYGNWGYAGDYGTAWYPRALPAGWAPYRYGRWAWVAPWGWTWIDAAPWGFAPFHYGRWLFIGGQWAWVPGTYTRRPVYAPALVAWIGSPDRNDPFNFGGQPALGWFPLAPQEVFVPAYPCTPTYVRQVNVTQVTNVTVIEQAINAGRVPVFAHRGKPHAVTVVPAGLIQSGQAITPVSVLPTDPRQLGQAPVSTRAPSAGWLPPTGHWPGRPAPAANQAGPLPAAPGSPPSSSLALDPPPAAQPSTATGKVQPPQALAPAPVQTAKPSPAPAPVLPWLMPAAPSGGAAPPPQRQPESPVPVPSAKPAAAPPIVLPQPAPAAAPPEKRQQPIPPIVPVSRPEAEREPERAPAVRGLPGPMRSPPVVPTSAPPPRPPTPAPAALPAQAAPARTPMEALRGITQPAKPADGHHGGHESKGEAGG